MNPELENEFGTEFRYTAVSGLAQDDVCVVGTRTPFEEAPDPDRMESWVLRIRRLAPDGDPYTDPALGNVTSYGGVWLSREGAVYVGDIWGRIYVLPSSKSDQFLDPTAWIERNLGQGARVHGLWGLDGGPVWAWGLSSNKPMLVRVDVEAPQPVAAPAFPITALRGSAPDVLFAGGEGGQLARWDGTAWRPMMLETSSAVSGLCVVSADEVWATTDNGKLFEGGQDGLGFRLKHESRLYDVAKWQEEVWLAAGSGGLWKLRGKQKQADLIKPNVRATQFDSRERLVMACPDMVVGTADGETFRATGRDQLQRILGPKLPMWEEDD